MDVQAVQMLVERGKLSQDLLPQILQWQEDTREEKLLELGYVDLDDIEEVYAYLYHVKVVEELPLVEDLPQCYERLSIEDLKEYQVLPFAKEGDVICIATSRPREMELLNTLEVLLSQRVEFFYCSKAKIEQRLQTLFSRKGAPSQWQPESKSVEKGVYDLLEATDKTPSITFLNHLLLEAIELGASDIHLEPLEGEWKIRYRIDGVLQIKSHMHIDLARQLIIRIKVMARLNIAEYRLPQDGRIRLSIAEKRVDLRISIVPIYEGQRVVVRILDRGKTLLDITQLNMGSIEESFRQTVAKKEGVVLVTGPTGSGKTTTLYSTLQLLNSPKVNIMTIEDPIEYRLSGISQMSIHPKIELDFAKGLKHLLRQDPDVIMIGEIRDKETAKTAIQAALTGHLVLSTLHTNEAASAFIRLCEMGVAEYLLSSSVIGILAQRLVRILCKECVERYTPSKEELEDLGIEASFLFRGKGCPACLGCGYKGRRAIFEWLPVTEKIQKQLVRLDSRTLRLAGAEEGMVTLKQHGAQLVKQGITTSFEIKRVVG